MILGVAACNSYRKMTQLLNRVLHREEEKSLKVSTIMEHVEAQGRKIKDHQHQAASEILQNVPGVSAAGVVESPDEVSVNARNPVSRAGSGIETKEEAFQETIDKYNEGKEDCDRIKNQKLIDDTEINPDECVYISIDDVGVKHQKDTRKDGGTKDGKYVENTVIHIESKEGKYTITDIGMKNAFTLLVAFLFSNGLLENRFLYFFSDGAQNIRSNIELFFKPLCPYKLFLDWYHLEKRMNELLSMALKGTKEQRHNIRYVLNQKLWAGNFGDAREYLSSLDKKNIKNQKKLDEAIDYLKRKADYAACYALRKNLGYNNSSNQAEKDNDLVVANRQKHNGMSWSYDGSGALATITAMSHNLETNEWIENRHIPFKPVTKDEPLAA
ncbi:MAG: hypothetical protein IJ727_06985 [Treponema sp.]|nr:hypothetical protein [Treponema sp.]